MVEDEVIVVPGEVRILMLYVEEWVIVVPAEVQKIEVLDDAFGQ